MAAPPHTPTLEEIVAKNLEEKKFDEAISICASHISDKGPSRAALSLRAKCFMKKGDYEKSLSDIESALKLDTPAPLAEKELLELCKQRADIFVEKGEIKEAIESFKRVKGSPKALEEASKEYIKLYEKEHGLAYGDPTMEKVEIFMKWMKSNGAKFDNIQMKYYGPDNRGVQAVKMIPKGTRFLIVPDTLIITQKRGMETPIGALVAKSGVDISWSYLFYIALFLMTEGRKDKSFWKPYIDVYPKSVSSFPMFYSDSEKLLLKGSPMYGIFSSNFASLVCEKMK